MEYIKKIKEYLKDPKKKSLTMLGIYAIFFIFVFAITSGGNSAPSYIPEENIDVITNYEYIYKINNNEQIEEIKGTINNNENIFNYNGLNYVKKDGIIYLNNSQVDNFIFDIDRYKYENIELLIENSDSKTTYQDSKKIVYTMSSNEYFELLNDSNLVDPNEIMISITVESDIYINNVIIDLSNYYGYKYTVEINYSNINGINKTSTN